MDIDLIKLLNEDQEKLENQIYNSKLKHLLKETLEKLKQSEQMLTEANKCKNFVLNTKSIIKAQTF